MRRRRAYCALVVGICAFGLIGKVFLYAEEADRLATCIQVPRGEPGEARGQPGPVTSVSGGQPWWEHPKQVCRIRGRAAGEIHAGARPAPRPTGRAVSLFV